MTAPELLAKLRAAGVEPLPTTSALALGTTTLRNLQKEMLLPLGPVPRLLAGLLEARATLDAVRTWAESETGPHPYTAFVHDPAPDIARRDCVEAVLAILDREPEP